MTLSFGGGAGVLTIPGVSGDGLTPPGLAVAGSVTAVGGFGNNPSFGPGDQQPLAFYDLDGNVAFTLAVGPAGIGGAGVSVGSSNAVGPSGMDVSTSSTADYAHVLRLSNGGGITANFAADGTATILLGLGLFGHAAPTTPRTLAQSVITAITDANAKTAVQALANALSDMGALTLT